MRHNGQASTLLPWFLSFPLPSSFCSVGSFSWSRVPSLRTVPNLPVVNLVASDFVRAILGILSIPVFAVSRKVPPSTADNDLCVAYRYINSVQIAWSSWAIAIIAYSRSDVIVNVLAPKFSKRKFWIFTVLSWIGLTSMMPFVGWGSYGFNWDGGEYLCHTGHTGEGLLHALYLPLFYAVNILIPNVLVILCFSRVIRVVRRRHVTTWKSRIGIQANVVFLSNIKPSSSDRTDEEQQQQHRWREAASKTKDILRSKAFAISSS